MAEHPSPNLPRLPADFWQPGREFSLYPFWFWNDDLSEAEITRQLDDFLAHGVSGFVIHCRVGLPRSLGWMSDALLGWMRFAVEEARKRDMGVILYDEGMYPSGSSSGQVVAANPAFQCRCLARLLLDEGQALALPAGHNRVAEVRQQDGRRAVFVDRPVDSTIRGLHYIGEGPEEDAPPAADILNPESVRMFLHLVYDRYAEALGEYFGSTILAIFTDEPDPLGRCREQGVFAGTTGMLEKVSAYLGYDFTPHLPALWEDGEPDAALQRENYQRAVMHCLEDSYYRQLADWCQAHHIQLTGHPARPDAIGLLRYFDIPGQDLVWRWVLPGTASALEGPESTQAKCSASAMLHLRRERNVNECFGAYGHEFTWEEMRWLADWCFVRGVNMLIPHAFYYSVRGPRVDERPPDVGPHSPWWRQVGAFAAYCRRLAWVNTHSQQVCQVAVPGESHHLPWDAAKILFQNQRDFNYLDFHHLVEDAEVSPQGIVRLAGMEYQALVLDGFERLPANTLDAFRRVAQAGRLVLWNCRPAGLEGAIYPDSAPELLAALALLCPPDVQTDRPQPGLRCRHVFKAGLHYYLFVNEDQPAISTQIEIRTPGRKAWVDPFTGSLVPAGAGLELFLPAYASKILVLEPA